MFATYARQIKKKRRVNAGAQGVAKTGLLRSLCRVVALPKGKVERPVPLPGSYPLLENRDD